jgi:mRNA interferase MazF
LGIKFHPKIGTILKCDFDSGFKVPEMVKRRPVVVVSPQIAQRASLCTVVAISTERPNIKLPYHYLLEVDLPPPYEEGPNWIKGDMVYSVSFNRLDLFRSGRDGSGKRVYESPIVTQEQLREIRKCMLCALGLASLTKHLP